MNSPTVKCLIVSLLLFLGGCAGTEFVRMSDDQLVLGRTTPEQITARLGAPYREGTLTKNDRQVRTMTYAYASTGGEAAADGVTPARGQGFYFFENKLVGWEFTSSWKADSTDFDGAKVQSIKRGESTRADVERLLGRAGGKLVYPMIPGRDEEAVNYVYSQTKGTAFNLQFYLKQLFVTFDRKGVVTNVEFVESGQR